MCFLTLINTVLEGIGNTKVPLFSLVLGVIIKFTVSFILIKNIHFGIIGAPIGTTSSYIISFLISAIYLSCRTKIKINFLIPFISVLFSSLIATVISEFAVYIFKVCETVNTVIYFAVWLLVYIALLIIVRFFDLKNILILAKCTKKQC